MAEYIERDVARELMYQKQSPLTEYDLDSIPAADAVEVVHARWEKRGNHDWGCSACKIGVPYDRTGDHYCYNCGARMDG